MPVFALRAPGQMLASDLNRTWSFAVTHNYNSVRKRLISMATVFDPLGSINMTGRVIWKIAAPMIGLGILLLVLGAFAAYNVHEQQRTSSEIVLHQAQAMLAIHELNIVMREIRYQVAAFVRTGDAMHLHMDKSHARFSASWRRTKRP